MIRNLRLSYPRILLNAAFAIVCLTMLVSCKSEGDKADSAGNPAQSTTGTQATTGPVEQVADSQLDYFTEKYISTEERLKRRQDRIKAVLNAAPPAPAP